ncbi:MAG: bifunctional diguanylate cyclase/phosphodiesterase [Ilumatobacter fluminis]|uniref:putative bifunctional diguanylate cyclase/phosphodiesterase n=1 Tax=Ilumatobacter fluminis TaxID=467091 RepID=UPI0032ECC44C
MADSVSRWRTIVPWMALVVIALVLTASLIAGQVITPFWNVTMVLVAVGVAVYSRAVNGIHAIYGVVMTVAVLHLVLSDAQRDIAVDRPLTWPEMLGDLAVAIGVVAALGFSTARRLGAPAGRYLVEVAVVFIGSSIATWVLLTQPLLDQGESASRAFVSSLFLPVTVLVAAFVVDLWNHGLRRNRAMQLCALSAIVFAAGSFAERLQLVGTVDVEGSLMGATVYSLAAALVLAAIAHPSFRYHLDDRTPAPTDVGRARLLIMGVSVLGAVTLTAVRPPDGPLDIAVRVGATVLLIVLVVVRLAIALHEHEVARRSLHERVHSDELTGLPTRTRFVEVVGDVLESNWRSEHQPTVIHLNLDRFKNINDTFGHHGANEVLSEVARRVAEAASSFGATVARIGGDEFAVIDASTTSVDDAVIHAEVLRAAVSRPIAVGEAPIFITTSVGVAMVPAKRSITAEELLRRADIANHRAKSDGANRVAVFDESMQDNVAKRMDIEHALHGAIGRQEMRLYHQPIVDISTGRVTGFEALIRWQRSDGTIMSPATFIPVAEDTGMICEIGAWALRDALSELRGWIDDGVVPPSTTMSVNVSPRQIADPNFASIVRHALSVTAVPAHLLWLEMTESMMLDEPELAENTLREIRAMGVQLALDDFGTGFSSLSLLQNFPIQRIKIDRAFVQGIAENTNDRSLVRTIIALGQSMGLDLVAEGVETVHQLQSLRDLGCNKAQGFLISHPVPAPAMGSTMTALAELSELSLFRATTAGTDRVDIPVPVPAGAGMVGMSPRGPIGQPVI